MSMVLHRAQRRTARRPTERRTFGRRIRRLGLGAFFASIAVNAALGIYAVLAPGFGDTQGKILGTSLCITGAVLLALSCEPAWERKFLGPVPYAGAGLGAAAFTLAIVGMWTEPASDVYGKAMGSTFTLAGAGAAASLLALARLAPRHGWVFLATLGLLALGAALAALAPWLGDDPSETYLRAMGVVLITLAAFAVTVPVLHWIDRGTLATADAATTAIRFCPYCGKTSSGDEGAELTCDRCGRVFTVNPSSST